MSVVLCRGAAETIYFNCSFLSSTFFHLICFLPLRKFPHPLFAVIVFSYRWDKKAGKGFYNGLWKFNFTVCFIGSIFWQRHFPFPKCRTRPAGRRNRERASCSSHRDRLSVHAENGADEFVFQTAFHVLVQAGMRTAAFVVDRPGAELVYVALVVPQDLLHSVSVPGMGRVAYRQRPVHGLCSYGTSWY